MSHWVKDVISLAYEAHWLSSPLSIQAHSTRGIALSLALCKGVSLEEICVAARWAFIRFYNLDIDMTPRSICLSGCRSCPPTFF